MLSLCYLSKEQEMLYKANVHDKINANKLRNIYHIPWRIQSKSNLFLFLKYAFKI